MADRTTELQGMSGILDIIGATPEQREQAMRGNKLFLDAGWPSNFVTAGMARIAGSGGPAPFPYDGRMHISANRYKKLAEDAGYPLPG